MENPRKSTPPSYRESSNIGIFARLPLTNRETQKIMQEGGSHDEEGQYRQIFLILFHEKLILRSSDHRGIRAKM